MSGKVISDVRWHVGLMTRTVPDDAGSEHRVQNRWHMSDERHFLSQVEDGAAWLEGVQLDTISILNSSWMIHPIDEVQRRADPR